MEEEKEEGEVGGHGSSQQDCNGAAGGGDRDKPLHPGTLLGEKW